MNADVEVYVVETDYNDYAIMLLQSTCRITGNKTKIMKLYSKWQKNEWAFCQLYYEGPDFPPS